MRDLITKTEIRLMLKRFLRCTCSQRSQCFSQQDSFHRCRALALRMAAAGPSQPYSPSPAQLKRTEIRAEVPRMRVDTFIHVCIDWRYHQNFAVQTLEAPLTSGKRPTDADPAATSSRTASQPDVGGQQFRLCESLSLACSSLSDATWKLRCMQTTDGNESEALSSQKSRRHNLVAVDATVVFKETAIRKWSETWSSMSLVPTPRHFSTVPTGTTDAHTAAAPATALATSAAATPTPNAAQSPQMQDAKI